MIPVAIHILTLMFSVLAALLLVFLIGSLDSFRSDMKEISRYLDRFAEQLAERYDQEVELIKTLSNAISVLTKLN